MVELSPPNPEEVLPNSRNRMYICTSVCDVYLFIGVYLSKNIMFSAYLYFPKCISKLTDIINTVPTAHPHVQSTLTLLSLYTVNKPPLEPEVTRKIDVKIR